MAFNFVYWDNGNFSLNRGTTDGIDHLAEFVLEEMASVQDYAGAISDTDFGGAGTAVGTFTDEYRSQGVGAKDLTILSSTQTLYQRRAVASQTDAPQYLGYSASGNNVDLQLNVTTLEQLADEIIDRMIGDPANGVYGVNSYVLAQNAPTGTPGDTWVDRGNFVDTLQNGTVVVSDFKLWHKTTSSNYSGINQRPLKWNGSELQEWSDAEIKNLIKTVEERIVATNRGYYALGSTAPAGGTWEQMGFALTDTRRNTQNVNYVGAVDFLGNYASTFVGNYAGNYVGPSGKFTATFFGNYAGNYVGNFVGNYVGSVSYTATEVANSTSNVSTVRLYQRTG